MKLDTPIQYIKGVGPKRAKEFAKLGIYTVQDLLEYYPFRWEFCPPISKIKDLEKLFTSEELNRGYST